MVINIRNYPLSNSKMVLFAIAVLFLCQTVTGSGIRGRKINENSHERKLQVGDWINDLVGGIGGIFDGLTDAVDSTTNGGFDAINNALDGASNVADEVTDTADNLSNIFGDAVTSTVDGASSTLGSIVESLPCFSAYNDVEVQGKGMVPMDSIKVGDYVRVFSHQNQNDHRVNNNKGEDSDKNFSRVFSLAHLDHDLETDFLQIHYDVHRVGNEKNGEQGSHNRPLEITKKHMMYVVGKGVVSADEVKIGDVLYHREDRNTNKSIKTEAIVSNIQSIKRKGVYAPITENGNLIVSGISASSYYAFLDGVPPNFQHTLTHFFFSPHRLLCSHYDFKLCKNETHSNGYTNWAYWAIQIMAVFNKTVVSAPIQYALALILSPILFSFYAFEQVIIAVVMIAKMILGVCTDSSSFIAILAPLSLAYSTKIRSEQDMRKFG